MSAREIVEQIAVLPDHEIKLVEAALRRRRVETARASAEHGGIRPEFENIVQKVFTTHEELLRKLAQ